jgi:hypothetical protein
MLAHVFAWGYEAWMTRQSGRYTLSGYIDGRVFAVVTDLPHDAETAFARAACSAWLRRRLRVLRGLPAQESPTIHPLDTCHETPLRMIGVAVLTLLWSRLFR